MPGGRKIIDTIQTVLADGGTTVSLEFFPAKTEEGMGNLLARIEAMVLQLQPTFVTLTWRSAFEDERLWLKIGTIVQKEFSVDVLLHLTCHLPRADLVRVLQNARDAGIRNILALRGDPPIGEDKWEAVSGGFSNAVELVQLIRDLHGDWFCVAVAGYPEVHTECWNSPDLPPSEQSQALDLCHLKEKVLAGADFVVSQFFYDVEKFQKFSDKCREIGIPANVPILPGYLPIQNYKSFRKFTSWCKTSVPRHIETALEKVKDDDEQVKAFGAEEAIRVCKRLLAHGHKTLHFYTLNLETTVTSVVEGLGLLPQPNLRELSWQRHNAMGSRTRAKGGPMEEVRPIFWANRQTSYVSRTNAWDEFPNGRWGDSRSPAYGELSHYYLEFKRPKIDRQKLWGLPTKQEDVYDVFCDFLDGKPAVDGRPSTDPEVGWGGPGGFVYQKAYVEFFCSPLKLKALMEELDRHPNLSYHAVNAAGEEYTNTQGKRVNAVTWGVFPGKEIVQPTVVDAESFQIWKDEAFELWLTQWASAYGEGSTSRAVIQEIYDSYFLVNIVDENYSAEHHQIAAAQTEASLKLVAAAGAAGAAGAWQQGKDEEEVRDGDAGIPMDIFTLFKRVITRHFTPEQLEHFSLNTQKENELLFGLVKELKAINHDTASENKQLRAQLVQFQKELADVKAEMNRIRTRGHETNKSNTLILSARRPVAAAASLSATQGNGGASSM
ncbi:hypothetical protein VYU27_000287 [Nannochloropsis oceanica]